MKRDGGGCIIIMCTQWWQKMVKFQNNIKEQVFFYVDSLKNSQIFNITPRKDTNRTSTDI